MYNVACIWYNIHVAYCTFRGKVTNIGFFDKLFGRATSDRVVTNTLNVSSTGSFSAFNGDIYESAVTRSCIHSIAANAAKLKPVHIIRKNGEISKPSNNKITNVIAQRPNVLMSAYDFYYKMITQVYNKNNAFALISRSSNGIDAMYPIDYSAVEAVEYAGELFMRFTLTNANRLTVAYADLIHIRRFFYDKEIFGSDNKALYPTLQVIDTTNEAMSEGVKSAATLRGILKFSTMLKDTDLKKQRDAFIDDYLDASNNGGVAATDSKMEYVPISSTPLLIDATQMAAIRDQVYMYFNVNEEFVTNAYDEDGWNAIYESLIESLAIQISQEMTYKVFSKTSMSLGNEIIFNSDRLAYASNKTKIQFVKEVGILGAVTLNEVREIFNMTPIEGGEKRVQTLNVVNAATADQYQNGGDTNVEE